MKCQVTEVLGNVDNEARQLAKAFQKERVPPEFHSISLIKTAQLLPQPLTLPA